MHVRARGLAALVSAALLCLGIAGCGSGGRVDAQPDWATVAPENASGNITVWAWAADQATVDKIAAKFMKRYPDVHVDFKYTSYQDYTKSLSAALASGEGPDAFIIEPQSLKQFAPLSEDLTPVLERQLGAKWRDQFTSSSVKELTSADDRVVGAPLQANGNGTLLVNQQLLDELGLQWPDNADSIEDLVSFCDQVRAKGKGCIGIGQDEWVHQDVFQTIANSLEPGVFTDAVRGKKRWTDPVLVEAFDIFQRLFAEEVTPEGALGMPMYPDMDNKWQQGDLVAFAAGSWAAMNLLAEKSVGFQKSAGVKNPKPIKASIVPWPAVGGKEVHMFASVYGGIAINKASKNKAAAAAWANWYALDKKGRQKDSADELIGIPALKGVDMAPEGLAHPKVGRQSLDFLTEEFTKSSDPRNIPYPELVTALGTAFEESATGKDSRSVAEKLETASSAITR